MRNIWQKELPEPQVVAIIDKDMRDMKVWVVLEEDRGLGAWAEVFSSKEKAEAVYGKSGRVQIYETEIDEKLHEDPLSNSHC
jgi:hypothetical protein